MDPIHSIQQLLHEELNGGFGKLFILANVREQRWPMNTEIGGSLLN